MLERHTNLVGDSSSNPEKSQVVEKGEVEREVEQVEDVVEPSKELERNDYLAGEVISEPVTQVMEMNEDGDYFVPLATVGLITTGTPEILTLEEPVAELDLERWWLLFHPREKRLKTVHGLILRLKGVS